ncbi:MAG TPA: YceH family protein [Burkholderiaceae bacterium]|jgi:uncharacterized protein YceH (UPF0502 family)|nr:YceH family protein [Burkholderiaceae bacterium]
MSFDPTQTPLSAAQARVLGTLMEKARTVPDSYPLSLNLVVTGANQKTSREPVMHMSEAQAQQALDDLVHLSLARPASGARVARWEHNAQRGLGVPEQSAVLLGLLMLRGPQTAAELRLNAERWYRFADTSSVEAFLDELQSRGADKGGPLVLHLPRAPGEREARWAQLLTGPVDTASLDGRRADAADDASGLGERVQALEAEVQTLRAQLAHLCQQLGVEPMSQP